MLVQPSDHVIADADAFHRAVMLGLAAAQDGRLVTFGVAGQLWDDPASQYR